MVEEIILPGLSYNIMNCLYVVHNELGSGLLEKHNQRAIAIELTKREISFEKEKMTQLLYQHQSVGRYFVDFVIEDKIVLEIKAAVHYKKAAYKQAFSYLKQLNLPLAIVVNFHSPSLEYRRIVNPNYQRKDSK